MDTSTGCSTCNIHNRDPSNSCSTCIEGKYAGTPGGSCSFTCSYKCDNTCDEISGDCDLCADSTGRDIDLNNCDCKLGYYEKSGGSTKICGVCAA